MKRSIARHQLLQVLTCQSMRFRQSKKWNGRVDVVFCMVRHIPGKSPDQRVGRQSSGIFKTIIYLRALGVFGKQVGTKKRLSQ